LILKTIIQVQLCGIRYVANGLTGTAYLRCALILDVACLEVVAELLGDYSCRHEDKDEKE
jgi:hypothetical protein